LLEELRVTAGETGRFPSVREVETLVQQRQGRHAVTPPTEGSVPALLETLRERGVPIDINVHLGKQTGVRVVLTVGEMDEEWLSALARASAE
jgi:hypothetical protein